MEIRTVIGTDARPYLDRLAALRIAVFRDWPYLYDGDLAYEEKYLATYARSPRSVFVLALDGEAVVGASTAMPLAEQPDTFQHTFREHGIDPATVFYFGESVLLTAYRGQGMGHRFFDEREAAAKRFGFSTTAFCAVDRDADDARRPADARSNDVFWQHRGYRRSEKLVCELDWQEVGAASATPHRLRFWLRERASDA
jgi:GNAT superfamily N-acetyltransferase